MISPQEAYKKYLLKVNKNDTNSNIKIPKGQFILIFNEEKRKWLTEISRRNENSDYIEEIEELLELDAEITKTADDSIKTSFSVPANFFKRATAYSLGSKGSCTGKRLNIWFIKPKDINVLLTNSDYNPSFEYEETLGIINSGRVSVYKGDFNIDKTFLSYYREPRDLNIAGYTQIDGSASFDQATDLSIENDEIIIDRAVEETLRNYQSPEQLQLAMQRRQIEQQP